MTPQSIRLGATEILITPAESEDGSFTASSRRHPDQPFDPADWTDPRTRLDAARSICESFSVTRNNQHMTKIANAIQSAMS